MTTDNSQSGRQLALVLLLITPALFAANMLAARWVQGAIPPVALSFWRWSLTFLMLLPFAGGALWRGCAEIARDWPDLLLLGALGMGLCGDPVYEGARTTTATNIGLIYAASPVLIVVLARFRGEAIGRLRILGIALCLLGELVILTRGEPAHLAGLSFVPGDLWIAVATAAWALYSVLLRYRPSRLDMVTRFAAIVAGGVIANAPFYALEIALGQPTPMTLYAIGVFVFVALVPGIGAYLCYAKLVALVGPGRTGLLLYLIPLYNVVLAWALLGEVPRLYHIMGVALILPGLWLGTRAQPQAQPRA